jgi:hypothetical protein
MDWSSLCWCCAMIFTSACWQSKLLHIPNNSVTKTEEPSVIVSIGRSDAHMVGAADFAFRSFKTKFSDTKELRIDSNFYRARLQGEQEVASEASSSTVLFHIGHGMVGSLSTQDGAVTQPEISIGDSHAENGSKLRYLWLCACRVFAHGPNKIVSEGEKDYAFPELFSDNGIDEMEDVYKRWVPSIGSNVRLACGASTLVQCWQRQAERIWDNFNTSNLDVADSFLEGVQFSYFVPVCLTRGPEEDPVRSAIYDTQIETAPNTKDAKYYHLEYTYNFDIKSLQRKPADPRLIDLPAAIKKLNDARRTRQTKTNRDVSPICAALAIGEFGPTICNNLASRGMPTKNMVVKESDFLAGAMGFVKAHNWCDQDCEDPRGVHLAIESRQILGGGAAAASKVIFQKGVIVTLRQIIDLSAMLDKEVRPVVFGRYGRIVLQMNNSGEVFGASRFWVGGQLEEFRGVPRSYEQARQLAYSSIHDAQHYRLVGETWGFVPVRGKMENSLLRAYFLFDFLPSNAEASLPLLSVNVPVDTSLPINPDSLEPVSGLSR